MRLIQLLSIKTKYEMDTRGGLNFLLPSFEKIVSFKYTLFPKWINMEIKFWGGITAKNKFMSKGAWTILEQNQMQHYVFMIIDKLTMPKDWAFKT